MEPVIAELERRVKELIADNPALFLVEIRIKPTNNIKIFIDGDQGVGIDQLTQYNRRLYRELEASNMFPNEDFSLELSSPGLDEPLKLRRQYVKNVGRFVEVIDKEGMKFEGKLESISEDSIDLEEVTGKGKKAITRHHIIFFDNIKSTKIQVKF